ncbi:asparagine synthetase B [Methanobrevibacter sp. TMH8]|uniref:DUF7411 family protein n=1 Tax=Methanobrevibacter sp. TMH8 TaxID=2848611 RepID=UPI001CC8F4DA|nr:asparagine synthetase B [Methanobrevibacter sp. TMH8]MBZ9570878.1 asparagine synthetase B [Methanobrevibacter sp. TMH8]
MSKIIGIQGKFDGNLLNSMLKAINYEDRLIKSKFKKGIFLSSENNTIFNNKFCNISFQNDKNNSFNIGLGVINPNDKELQPIQYKNLTLVFDGVIYNIDEINSILSNSNNEDVVYSSEILAIKLIYKFYSEFSDLKKSIEKVKNLINGDYAFAVFDGTNLAISRDSLGVNPLYYNVNDFNSFASEKKSLWKIGINNNDISSLKPGHILYNWKDFPSKSNPWDIDYSDHNDFVLDTDEEDNYYKFKNYLSKLIMNSTYDRIKGLDKVGLVFSGGVDSTILATILKKYSESSKIDVTLYTVGVENSIDLKYSKKIAKKLDFTLKTQIIDEELVRKSLNPVLKAIEEEDLMKVGVGMTLYLGTKLAFNDDIPVVLAGQGADELFGGYYRYLATLNQKGEDQLQKELIHDMKYCYDVNLERDAKIASSNGVQLRVPYLDEKVVNFALNIPIKYKIKLNENNEDPLRKRILRDLALDIGVDEEIAMRPKKAAQYGSGIDKIIRKKILKDTDLNKIMENIIDSYSNNKN